MGINKFSAERQREFLDINLLLITNTTFLLLLLAASNRTKKYCPTHTVQPPLAHW
jgi:hypothetical protein